MVPPPPLASLSSLADRFATILHHRQGPILTPGNQIVIQIIRVFLSVVLGCLYLTTTGCFPWQGTIFPAVFVGRSRLPIFDNDRSFFYLPVRLNLPAVTIALAALLTCSPARDSRSSLVPEPPVIPSWTSLGVKVTGLCDRPLD
jgi:hypothetical protein